MDHSDQRQQMQNQQSNMGVLAGGGQSPYPVSPYQSSTVVATGTPAMSVSSPTPFPPHPHQQLGFYQPQPFQNPQQQQQLQAFWANQMQDVERSSDFKNHSLPLARIKKIMKADEDVKMISAEAPVVFAKACEMFILELTLRSWIHTEENKRRTLQKNDIAAAISRTDVFDFLVDIIPRDELKDEGIGIGISKPGLPLVGSPNDVPYYYMQNNPMGAAGGGGMMMGKPVDPRGTLPFMPWPQSMIQPPAQQQEPDDSQ